MAVDNLELAMKIAAVLDVYNTDSQAFVSNLCELSKLVNEDMLTEGQRIMAITLCGRQIGRLGALDKLTNVALPPTPEVDPKEDPDKRTTYRLTDAAEEYLLSTAPARYQAEFIRRIIWMDIVESPHSDIGDMPKDPVPCENAHSVVLPTSWDLHLTKNPAGVQKSLYLSHLLIKHKSK